MPRSDPARIAVLGAGPIGLEAALYARTRGLSVTVYERGRIGEHLHRWGHVTLFSPFGMNTTSPGRAAILAENPRHEFPADGACITGRQHVAVYLDPLTKTPALKDCVRTGVEVLHVGRRGCLKDDAPSDAKRGVQPFRLLLREDKKERIEEADVVLDCTGVYSQHRWFGDGGIPAVGEMNAEPHVAYDLPDVLGEQKNHYAGKNILVVGGGYSAATTVCHLARLAEEHPDTWVIWVTRGSNSQPLKRIAADPLKERDRLALRANTLATRTEGNVEFHPSTRIESVTHNGSDKGFTVAARCGGERRTWEVDRIVANVGYAPNRGLYRELQVHECYASEGPMGIAAALLKSQGGDCLTSPPVGAAALRTPEPNFFILGAKSYGRSSQFLLRTGFEQIRDAFALFTGRADLDLYKKR